MGPGIDTRTHSHVSHAEHSPPQTLRAALLCVALTLGISYAVVLPCFMLGLDWDVVIPLRLIVVVAPAVSAVITTRLVSGEAGLVNLLASFRKWRVGAHWYVLALSLFLALALASCGIRYVLDGTPVTITDTRPVAWVLGWIPLFLIPGLAEEPGWRGFLQPHLGWRLSGRLLPAES